MKADGGYVLAPPSNHISGRGYDWISPISIGSSPPDVPANWLPLILTANKSNRPDVGLLSVDRSSIDNTDTTDTTATTDILYSAVSVPWTSEVDRRVRAIVRRCVIKKPGTTNDNYALRLARKLKSILELQGLDAEVFEPVIREWYRLSLKNMSQKKWDNVWDRWLYLWTWATGFDQPWEAYKLASELPVPLVAEKYPSQKLRLLIAICKIMQERFADMDGVWYLSCRDAADLIGVGHGIASRWLNMLARHSVLIKVGQHTKGSGKAQRFRYTGDERKFTANDNVEPAA